MRPRILILSNRLDFACDYVVARLRESGVSYLRLNHEDFPSLDLALYPVEARVLVRIKGREFCIDSDTLEAIYFRRPTFLRETRRPESSADGELARQQWTALARSFQVFKECRWMNHPAKTYSAENKALQLLTAADIGLPVPTTCITNDASRAYEVQEGASRVVVKGLDTLYLECGDTMRFGYTNILSPEEMKEYPTRHAPMMLQSLLEPKVDLRVTVVGENVFSVRILRDGHGVVGDWRRVKDGVTFEAFELPGTVAKACIDLVGKLGLTYGAIDLALCRDEFFFLEVNPTGEWAWLVDAAGLPIDKAIASFLTDKKWERC